MAKKLTKKEIARLEEIKKEKYNYRDRLVNAVGSFYDDLHVTEKYYKLNNMTDKLTYYGSLKDNEEKQNLLDRYQILKELNVKVDYDQDDENRETWLVLNAIRNTVRKDRDILDRDMSLETDFTKEDLYIDDTIWDKETKKIFIDYALKCGFTRIQYFHDNSSGSLEDIYDFINYGCKVIGTNTIYRKSMWAKDENDKEIWHRGIVLELPIEENK